MDVDGIDQIKCKVFVHKKRKNYYGDISSGDLETTRYPTLFDPNITLDGIDNDYAFGKADKMKKFDLVEATLLIKKNHG